MVKLTGNFRRWQGPLSYPLLCSLLILISCGILYGSEKMSGKELIIDKKTIPKINPIDPHKSQ
jgi:hypothetical protein